MGQSKRGNAKITYGVDMPKLLKRTYDVNDKDTNNAADKERKERQETIERLWNYYWGDHPKPLRIEAGMDDNVVLNLCGMAIDKKVAFLLPDDITFLLPQPETETDTPIQPDNADDPTHEYIELWLDENNYPQFLVDMAISGMIAGHTFVKLYYGPENQVYFSLLDPTQVIVFWQRGLSLEAAWYNIQWMDGDTNYRQDIVPSWMFTAQEGDDTSANQWVIIDYMMDKGGKWIEQARDVWSFEFPPIVDWKNKYKPFAYYGASDISHYGLNDAVNFLASNTNKIIRFHASPRVVAKDVVMPRDPMTGEQVPYNPNDIIEIGPNGEMYLLEPAADLVSSMTLLEKLQNMFFTQAKVIDLATIQDKLGQITNFGVRMMFADTLADLRQKQQLYGDGLAWLIVYGMAAQNVAIPLPVLQWPDPLPENMLEKAQIAQIEKNIGTASTQTLSEEMGHDWATEEERLAADAEQSATALDRVMQGQGGFIGGNNGAQS